MNLHSKPTHFMRSTDGIRSHACSWCRARYGALATAAFGRSNGLTRSTQREHLLIGASAGPSIVPIACGWHADGPHSQSIFIGASAGPSSVPSSPYFGAGRPAYGRGCDGGAVLSFAGSASEYLQGMVGRGWVQGVVGRGEGRGW